MTAFLSFSGAVTKIEDFWTGIEGQSGCNKLISLQNRDGNIVNYVVTPSTYFVDHAMVAVGDWVTGYSDANAAVPLIYPPQYQALVMTRFTAGQNVKVDYFNSQLISSDGMLKINITPFTLILLENGQAFRGSPANRNLIVLYSSATNSIPAQTVPYRIIVMCQHT